MCDRAMLMMHEERYQNFSSVELNEEGETGHDFAWSRALQVAGNEQVELLMRTVL